mmetsp:Transcript_5522/g.14916  ORF Transcript_5522/g.14916 Transcript_5522/m.14916 type:complete len:252 (+) Transcript_5522:472-1227(+)
MVRAGRDAHALAEARDPRPGQLLPLLVELQRPRARAHVDQHADALAAAECDALRERPELSRVPVVLVEPDAGARGVALGQAPHAGSEVALARLAHLRLVHHPDEVARPHGVALRPVWVVEGDLPVVLPHARQPVLPYHHPAAAHLPGRGLAQKRQGVARVRHPLVPALPRVPRGAPGPSDAHAVRLGARVHVGAGGLAGGSSPLLARLSDRGSLGLGLLIWLRRPGAFRSGAPHRLFEATPPIWRSLGGPP